MAGVVKKTANALSQESTLLNVHADLKAVSNKFEGLISSVEGANKRVLNWAERTEDARIQELLHAVVELEQEKSAVDTQYNESYKIFVKLWKGIIAEKKELNSELKALESARNNLKEKAKKASRAEQKEPQHKVEQRLTELEEAKVKEASAAQQVAQKLLEVQKDKHQTLRSGYTGLYLATMSRLKKHVEVQERMRKLVNAFPAVVARKEDGTYEFEPFPQNQDQDIWWQGEELQKRLNFLKQQFEEEKRVITKQHNAKVDELVKRTQQMAESYEKARHGDLSGLAEEHNSVLENMKLSHQAKIEDLNEQQASMEESHASALVAAEEKYEALENQLKGSHQKMQEQIEAYKKLDQKLDTVLKNIVSRSRKSAIDQISHAAIGSKQQSMITFLESAAQVRNSAEALGLLLQDELDGSKSDVIDSRVSSFASGVSVALVAAAGAAQCSQAENSMNLVEALAPIPGIAKALLIKFNVDDGALSRQSSIVTTSSPEPKKDLVIGLYRHEGKVQDGFNLVGFDKGQILTLIKRREDGWSRVRCDDDTEGWAPTSYLQDYTPPAETPAASDGGDDRDVTGTAAEVVFKFVRVFDEAIEIAKKIQIRDRELQKLANQVVSAIDDKVSAAQQSIMDATALFTRLLAQSKANDVARTLEVNTQLLDLCLKMQNGMERVINSAEGMRGALLRSKGSQSDSDFNTKHQSWFEALTTSVDAVYEGNPMLTEAVRSVLARKGKHEELQVASRNITASVAQLSALSKTKNLADAGQDQQGAQNAVTKNCSQVIECGSQLLAATREAQDLELASVLMDDLSNLSANQAKRLTMATQVNVLKLEKDLEREREKLGQLRRMNYDQ